MVSGTPLTRHIGDLHGELNFLQVRGVGSGSLGYLARSIAFRRVHAFVGLGYLLDCHFTMFSADSWMGSEDLDI